eukprot:652663_1
METQLKRMWLWTALAVLILSTTSSYKLVVRNKKISWDDAEQHCQKGYKSHLASFNKDADAEEILELAKEDGSGCPTDTDPCIGEAFTYWRAGRPLKSPNKNNCGVIQPFNPLGVANMVDDVKCTASVMNFICNDPPDKGEKVGCIESGLQLGLSHECTCTNAITSYWCQEEERYCNLYDGVWSEVDGSVLPGFVSCSGDEICCCSCQNCPGYEPLT